MRREEEQRRREQNAQRADEQLAVNFDLLLNAAPAHGEDGVWTTQGVSRKKKRQMLRRGLQKNDFMTPDQVSLTLHDKHLHT